MQNVFIINYNSLYEILDEIKENLSFKVINFENEEDFKKNNDLDTLNCLIISEINPEFLLNKNLNYKNFFDLSNLPLPLKKLLESINIKLIKLKFNNQSKIIIKGYELNLNSKFFSKENLNLKLTEKEIEIILYLNDLPLPLKKLLELINIRLIKLKFNSQSKIIIKGYELNLNSKFFAKGNINFSSLNKSLIFFRNL